MVTKTRDLRFLCCVFAISFLTASTTWSQVMPSGPIASPPAEAAIPPLPNATGPLFQAPVQLTGATSVHEGVFTWGLDLTAPPTTDRDVWKGLQFVVPGSPLYDALKYTATPALNDHVEEALIVANTKLDEVDAGGIGSVFSTFVDAVNLISGAHAAVINEPTAPHKPFLGFTPVRSRWLHSQWVPVAPVTITPFQPEHQYVYDDYLAFRDIRLRGARFYCAARTAQVQQAGKRLSLGQRVGFPLSILGAQIDFLVVEPSVSLNGPEKFFAPGDGAQAFTIPLLLGTTITPIRGIGLPSLGEARVPAVFVTADTEVRSQANKRQIYMGMKKGVPLLVKDYSKEYYTVTHSDAFLSAGFYGDQRFEVETDFLLFTIGPLQVRGLMGLNYNLGALRANTSEVPDDRVLFNFPAGWPASRTGHRYVNPFSGTQYHDGAWAFAARRGSPYFQWEVQPEGATDPFWRISIFPFVRPHDLRALSDDDHIVSNATSLRLTLGLSGLLGVSDLGPFEVNVHVNGTFSGTVTEHTMLREALMAQAPVGATAMRPFTALTVRPRQTAEVQFDGLKAALTFHLDLGFFGDIDFTKTFIDTPAQSIADYDSDASPGTADEQYMFRIATGATSGNAMTQPNVLSHLPGGNDFKTFTTDVAACLADETPLPSAPDPCVPGPSSGAPPSAALCLYGPEFLIQENFIGTMLPQNVCPNIQGWLSTLNLGGGQKLCLAKYLGFLCKPVSQEQSWQGTNVISRIWNLDPKLNAEIRDIAEECGEAFVGTELPPDNPEVHQKIEDFVAGLIGVSACNATTAALIPSDQILQVLNPTTPPSPTSGQVCKQ